MKPAKLIARLRHLNVLLNAHQKIRTAGEIVSEKTQFASIVRMLFKLWKASIGSCTIKWDASFTSNSACGSKELVTIGKMHPTLSQFDLYFKFVRVKKIVQMAATIARMGQCKIDS